MSYASTIFCSMLVLRKITGEDEAAVHQAVEEFRTTPEFIFAWGLEPKMTFTDYLQRLDDYECARNLPTDHVPSTMLFAFVGSKCVGRLMIRHQLNEFLLRAGGHIGYGVAPQSRQKGYAKAMLKAALPIARSLNIERALITCDADNIGSIKTIEANGGVLENTVSMGENRPSKRRYWIDLA